ncbi:MAG: hypothetical protein M1831_006008 [Alyxoria varia]|nr:MAG: hypothetical protein M1831_006008 [Alyxoria varia]
MEYGTLQTLLLDRQPCCLEVYPDRPDVIIVGTYNLVEDGSPGAKVDRSTGTDTGTPETQLIPSDTETRRGSREADESSFEEVDVNESQKRDGSLELFQFQDGRLKAHSLALHLDYGVLDIHYEPRLQCFGAATSIGSIALFRINHQGENQDSELSIQYVRSICIADPNTVLTCFAWNPERAGSLAIGAASGEVFLVDLPVSTTSTQQETPTRHQLWNIVPGQWRQTVLHRHKEPCWTVAFSTLERLVYSGGDDSALISTRYTWDTEAAGATNNTLSQSIGNTHQSSSEPHENPRHACNYDLHRAGITAIVPLHRRLIQFADESRDVVEFLATGSYDECFRILMVQHDRENTKERDPTRLFTKLLDLPLGGGAWRIKVITQGFMKLSGRTLYVAYILVSCMQAGARVIEVQCDHGSETGYYWKGEVVAHYREHGSLVYDTAFFHGHEGDPVPSDTGPAGFWTPERPTSSETNAPESSQETSEISLKSPQGSWGRSMLRRVVTCSFYDKSLCVSHMKKLLPHLEEPDHRHFGYEDNASI